MQELARRTDVPTGWDEVRQLAQIISTSDLVPKELRGRPGNVFMILLAARALDVYAFFALQSIHVIEGRLSISAELMRGLAFRAGHEMEILEETSTVATVRMRRAGAEKWFTTSFSMEDAQRAGLTKRENWVKWPAAMLLARASSKAVRAICPDVLFGIVYTPDELGADTDESGVPVIEGTITPEPPETPEPDPELLLRVTELVIGVDGEPMQELMQAAAAYHTAQQLAADAAPAAGGYTLAQLWAARLHAAAHAAQTIEDLRVVWQAGNSTHSLAVAVGEGDNLATVIHTYRGLLETAAATAAAEPAGPEPVEIATPHAEALRAAATESWADADTDPT